MVDLKSRGMGEIRNMEVMYREVGKVGKEWELGNGGTGSLWNWVVKLMLCSKKGKLWRGVKVMEGQMYGELGEVG